MLNRHFIAAHKRSLAMISASVPISRRFRSRTESSVNSYDTAPSLDIVTNDDDEDSMSLTIYPSPGLEMKAPMPEKPKASALLDNDSGSETEPPPGYYCHEEDDSTHEQQQALPPSPPMSITPTQTQSVILHNAPFAFDEDIYSEEALQDLNFTETCEVMLRKTKEHLFITDLEREHVVAFANLPDATVYEKQNPMMPFDKVQFFEQNPDDPNDTHYYLVYNEHFERYERCKGSVTGVAHSPFKHFDQDQQAQRIADDKRQFGEYAGKTKDEILQMWEFGSECGSAFHRAAEYFLNFHVKLLQAGACEHLKKMQNSPVFETLEFRYFLNFVRNEIVGKYDIVRTELRLCDWAESRQDTTAETRLLAGGYYERDPVMQMLLPMTKLAGSADLVVRRRGADPKVVQIWDWKRSKKIRSSSWENAFGKWPCDSMPDCNESQYRIQLNLYKWMLEHNSDYVVERMCIVVFHPNNESYMLYEVPDLQPKIQRILIQRLRHNRDKVYTSDDDEMHVHYRKQIAQYFAEAPNDPTDFLDFLHKNDNQSPQKSTLTSPKKRKTGENTAVVVEIN